MSKSSKAASRTKRLQQRRARREANRLLYERRKQAGINGKSQRARRSAKTNRLVNVFDHPNGRCGNLACKRCFVVGRYASGLQYVKSA